MHKLVTLSPHLWLLGALWSKYLKQQQSITQSFKLCFYVIHRVIEIQIHTWINIAYIYFDMYSKI